MTNQRRMDNTDAMFRIWFTFAVIFCFVLLLHFFGGLRWLEGDRPSPEAQAIAASINNHPERWARDPYDDSEMITGDDKHRLTLDFEFVSSIRVSGEETPKTGEAPGFAHAWFMPESASVALVKHAYKRWMAAHPTKPEASLDRTLFKALGGLK